MKLAGIAAVPLGDGKGQLVRGQAKGIVVGLQPTMCEKNGCAVLYFLGFFGQQDAVDLAFMNRFNGSNVAKMFKTQDGKVVLWFTVRMTNGVTRGNLSAVASSFMQSVQSALDFKPS